MRTKALRAILVAFALTSSSLTITATTASASSNTVSEITDNAARALSAELLDPAVRAGLTQLAPVTPVDMAKLDVRGRLARTIDKANTDLLAVKGLPKASALAYIADLGAYTPLVDAILQAMPSSWWTDDPDFVDACYAVTREANWTRDCAGGNGTLSVQPFWVSEL